MIATIDIPGPNALQPGNLFRFLTVGWPLQMAHSGTCCTQEPLKLHTGHNIRVGGVVIGIEPAGIKGFKPGRQDHRAHIELQLFNSLFMGFEGYSLSLTRFHTLVAFAASTTVETPLRLGPAGFFIHQKAHFFKAGKSLLHRQCGNPHSVQGRRVVRNLHPVGAHGRFVLPFGGQFFTLKIFDHIPGRPLSGIHRFNDGGRARDDVAAGKNAGDTGLKCLAVDL